MDPARFAAAVVPLLAPTGLHGVPRARPLPGRQRRRAAHRGALPEALRRQGVRGRGRGHERPGPAQPLPGLPRDRRARGARAGRRSRADVVGPVCETGDFLALDRELPGRGARASGSPCSAPAPTASSWRRTTTRRPRPAEVMVDGDRWWVARRAGDGRGAVSGEQMSRHDARPTSQEHHDRAPASRRHPDHRLRLAVHPAHRPPGARGARLLRDPSAVPHGGVDPRLEAQGHHPLGRPELGLRRQRARPPIPRCSSWARRCSASATACSCSPTSRAATSRGPAGASTAGPA